MRFGEIHRRLFTGELVAKNTAGSMAAIEQLAQIEGVAIDRLEMAAPTFALKYPRQLGPIGMGMNATSYERWRKTLLDLQMTAAPGNTDGEPWASLRRAARLSGAKQVVNALYQLSSRLPADLEPHRVTTAILRQAATEFREDVQSFRQGSRAFLRLFEMPLAMATGLLPPDTPEMPPSRHDHRAHAPLSPHLQKLRQEMAAGRYVHALDYINRLAFAGGLLNGRTDRVADLLNVLMHLPEPITVDVPSVGPGVLRSYRYHVQAAARRHVLR